MSPPLFGKLPSVNELLDSPPLKQLVDRANRHSVVAGVGRFLERMREDVRAATADIPNPVELAERIASWLASADSTAPRPAINATGDFLQLDVEGGAPLSDAARDAVSEVARGSGVVAGDLARGRGDRDQAAEQRACELAGAEAAALFPAGPGALLVTLAALSAGQGTVVSRGQILELDGIPLPDLVAASRARLLEVGTTNVTRLADFAAHALPPETALFLVLAPRSYRFAGEHSQPPLAALAALARSHGIPLCVDLGWSGLVNSLADASASSPAGTAVSAPLGPPVGPPSAREALAWGVDLCLVRGDKLLGGPACIVAVGRREIVDRLREHPLRECFRLDAFTLAALTATLQQQAAATNGAPPLPVQLLLEVSPENLKNRAERLAPQLAALPGIAAATARECRGQLAAPAEGVAERITWCVALRPVDGDADTLLARLRGAQPAILGRRSQDEVLLDLRSVLPRQDVELVEAATQALAPPAST
ncbi:MAG: hypothetical protein U0935_22755 [Pirellulales bacterium]